MATASLSMRGRVDRAGGVMARASPCPFKFAARVGAVETGRGMPIESEFGSVEYRLMRLPSADLGKAPYTVGKQRGSEMPN